MKLFLRTATGCRVPGGRALVLCDEHGEMLPGQCSVAVVQDEDAQTKITVSFGVDGKNVVMDCSEIEESC